MRRSCKLVDHVAGWYHGVSKLRRNEGDQAGVGSHCGIVKLDGVWKSPKHRNRILGPITPYSNHLKKNSIKKIIIKNK